MTADPKFERVNNLVALLLETRRPLTIDEILDQVPGYEGSDTAKTRMFERDKEDLRELGIPLAMESLDPFTDAEHGYRISREEYYLPELDLDADERAALHVAVSAVRFEEEDAFRALFKLGGLEGAGSERVAALASPPSLGTIVDALQRQRRLGFSYHDEERDIDPWSLIFRNGQWYLVGFDRLRGDARSFRVDRLQSPAVVLDEPATAPPDGVVPADILDADPWTFGDEEPVVARVLLDPVVAGFEPEARVVERRSDGSVVAEFPVTNRAAFCSYILGYLDRAEVLEPAELRDDITSRLRALAGLSPGEGTP